MRVFTDACPPALYEQSNCAIQSNITITNSMISQGGHSGTRRHLELLSPQDAQPASHPPLCSHHKEESQHHWHSFQVRHTKLNDRWRYTYFVQCITALCVCVCVCCINSGCHIMVLIPSCFMILIVLCCYFFPDHQHHSISLLLFMFLIIFLLPLSKWIQT